MDTYDSLLNQMPERKDGEEWGVGDRGRGAGVIPRYRNIFCSYG